MHIHKLLICGSIGIMGNGVIYDIFHGGDDHTVPRVPLSVSAATSTVSYSAGVLISYTANTVTGDEFGVPPRERRVPSTQPSERPLTAGLRYQIAAKLSGG